MIARDGQTRNQAQARWAVVVAREGIGMRAQALPVVRGSEEHRPEAQGFETSPIRVDQGRLVGHRGTPPRGAGV